MPTLTCEGCGASLAWPVNALLIQTCETCAHRVEVTGWDDRPDIRHQCRRFPPAADKSFPLVGLGQWCGEHKARMDGQA